MEQMSEHDWLLLSKLVDRYSSLNDGVELFKRMHPKNEKVKIISKKLAEGLIISDILSDKGFEGQIKFYCKYIPISNAIEIAYQNKTKKIGFQKRFFGKISYHLLLLLLSLVILSVFSNIVLPQIVSTLKIDTELSNSLLKTFTLIDIIKNTILCFLGLVSIFISYVFLLKKENVVWVLLHKLKIDKYIKVFVTYKFALKLKVLLDNGVKLNDAVQIIRSNTNDRMVALLAFHFNETLNKGLDIKSALENEFFDNSFAEICIFGLIDHDFTFSLDDYLLTIEEKIKKMIDGFSLITQILCYFLTFMVVIMAYQVLMLPLELLEGL